MPLCDNGLFCDGAETCDAVSTIVRPGSEAMSRPERATKPTDDLCVDCFVDADCDNGLFCDGAETCARRVPCLAGTPPCRSTMASACTDDSCDEATDLIVNARPNDAVCDNGLFCDGCGDLRRRCNDCQAGTAVDLQMTAWAARSTRCNEGTDVVRQHAAIDGLCDNGLFCDGAETCDAVQRLPGWNTTGHRRWRRLHR